LSSLPKAYTGPSCPESYSFSRSRSTRDVHTTTARFVLAGESHFRFTDSLLLAERVHLALVKLSDASPVFTGCDDNGEPLQGHGHARILCESNPGLGRGSRGEITHITVYASMGFSPEDLKALSNLSRVWGPDQDVGLALIGVGQPEDFGGLDVSKGKCPLLAEAKAWISRTPFLPTRHPKSTRAGVPKLDLGGLQIGSPEHELRRLLALEGLPEPVAVEPVYFTDLAGQKVSWSSFHRTRSFGNGRRAGNVGYGFRVEFDEAVRGPIAVGYGEHFGMGLFEARDPS